MDRTPTAWDETVDILVVGTGAAGMTAALVASIEGLDVLLCEKSDMAGGTTSTSAGTLWIPGSSQSARAGIPDTTDAARTYLRAAIKTDEGEAARETFLETGPRVLDYLEQHSDVVFSAAPVHPDYLDLPGAAMGGRPIAAKPFDGRLLGADFRRVRPPRPEFMILGGMMVAKADIPALLKPFSSVNAFRQVAGLLLRYGIDRLRYRRGTRLVMGNALVGRLLYSLRRRQVPVRFETRLVDLCIADGTVTGAVLDGPEGRRTVRARKGVVLATGGVGWNRQLRDRLFPQAARSLSLSPESNTGDGIETALRDTGAQMDIALESAGLWMPCSILKRPDGSTSVYPHIVLDRAKPGLMAVNKAGRRFVNEAGSYHDFVMGMLRSNSLGSADPAYLICDRSFVRDFGIGLIHPGMRNLKPFIDAGYLIEADSLAALAARIGVDAEGLATSVANYNRYARTGVDEEFGRGSTPLNTVNGEPANTPNPCLRPIGPGPFCAVVVWPADLASSAGLQTDENARVVASGGQPVLGLYACGNDATSIFRGTYPGPGTTLGPAVVFAWRAIMNALVANGTAPRDKGKPR